MKYIKLFENFMLNENFYEYTEKIAEEIKKKLIRNTSYQIADTIIDFSKRKIIPIS